MIELGLIDTWLSELLSGDAALVALLDGEERIYADIAPTDAKYPLVVYQMLGDAHDIQVHNNIRIMCEAPYMVKVIDEGMSYAQAQLIADRVDFLLTRASGAVAGGRIEYCVRERPIRYPEQSDDGREYRHLGGEYTIRAQASA
jgi:hypothetical protein